MAGTPDGVKKARATIGDVAKIAGVSIATVSQTISGNRPVSAETADRVRAAIAYSGYVPNSAARSLQAGRAHMLGLVVPDISDSFFGTLARSVERKADELGYGVIVSSSSKATHHHERTLAMLRSSAIDGLLYVAGDAAPDDQLQRIAADYPVVLADESSPALSDLPLITCDQEAGGRLVGEHLRDLGHSRVAVITGPRGLRTAEERLRGFLDVHPQAYIVDGDYTQEMAYYQASKLLVQKDPPSAIFSSNDSGAFGAIDAAQDRGLVIPRDLSVVGFDDVALSARFSPALTTVRQPITEIGSLATATLIRILNGESVTASPPVPVQLIIRSSSAAADAN